MKTITNSEFLANPEMYFGMARKQEVNIINEGELFHLIHGEFADWSDDDEPIDEKTWEAIGKFFDEMEPDGPPPMLSDEEEIANSITVEELMGGVREDLREMVAKGKHNVQ